MTSRGAKPGEAHHCAKLTRDVESRDVERCPLMPWYYRLRFTNWLIARPWRWNIRLIYSALRSVNVPRVRAAWHAVTWPHIHHESED